MLGLYLLAAHLVGDFLLQTRWQAAGKLLDWRHRARHVASYGLPFVGVVAAVLPGWWRSVAFLCALLGLHYATDSRRFRSTLGDVVGWRLRRRFVADGDPAGWYVGPWLVNPEELRLPPNGWDPLALCLDQTLHIAQLAILGGVLLT